MNKAEIISYFENLAPEYDKWLKRNKFYHSCINSLYASIIAPYSSVLEIGCATGELLNYLNPSFGVGLDLSNNMIEIARRKYPHLKFICKDVNDLERDEFDFKFDYIILSNLVDYLPDILNVLNKVKEFLAQDGLVIITTENPFWQPLMRLGSKLKLRMPDGPRNFMTNCDISNIVQLSELETVKTGLKFFIPVKIPFLSSLINLVVSETWLLRNFCLLQYLIARCHKERSELSCSVIIPCHNEAENIAQCIKSVPRIGRSTEIIVVDDGSNDDTRSIIENTIKTDSRVKLISYPENKGKGYAVRSGCDAAGGDVLIILDADMSVLPGELTKFFEPIQQGKADFMNGTRMVYPMQGQAMRTLNYAGNKLFNLILSWLIEQRISDTLCGTKAFLKKDYKKISMGRCKWGDFDLLFGIAKLKKKILEVPVHYQARQAGKSKMRVLKHGLLLAKMCWIGLFELKFFKQAYVRTG
jgi:SAM-dependent methyltransferase